MTTLPHLASRVFNTPLMVDSRKRAAILAALAPRMGIEPPAVEAALLAEQRSRKPYAIAGGVAVIEIAGSLVNRAYGLEPQSGRLAIRRAARDAGHETGLSGRVDLCPPHSRGRQGWHYGDARPADVPLRGPRYLHGRWTH